MLHPILLEDALYIYVTTLRKLRSFMAISTYEYRQRCSRNRTFILTSHSHVFPPSFNEDLHFVDKTKVAALPAVCLCNPFS